MKKFWRAIIQYTIKGKQGRSLRKLIVGVHSPNLPINRFRVSLIYQQRGLIMSFISNEMLTNTSDMLQMCWQGKYCRGVSHPHTPYGYTPEGKALKFIFTLALLNELLSKEPLHQRAYMQDDMKVKEIVLQKTKSQKSVSISKFSFCQQSWRKTFIETCNVKCIVY